MKVVSILMSKVDFSPKVYIVNHDVQDLHNVYHNLDGVQDENITFFNIVSGNSILGIFNSRKSTYTVYKIYSGFPAIGRG